MINDTILDTFQEERAKEIAKTIAPYDDSNLKVTKVNYSEFIRLLTRAAPSE